MKAPKIAIEVQSPIDQYESVTLVVEHRTSKGLDTFQLRSPDDQRSVFPVKKIVPRDAREMVATALLPKSYQPIRYRIELSLSTHVHSRIVLAMNCSGCTRWITSPPVSQP